MRAWVGAVLVVLLAAPPAMAGPWLAQPEARLTLQVDEVSLPALLVFLARVGGSELSVELAVSGTARNVRFEQVRVEDAFERLISSNGLAVRRVGDKLLVTRGEIVRPPVPPIAPAPARPELIVPQ